jgi:hypothetical protein
MFNLDNKFVKLVLENEKAKIVKYDLSGKYIKKGLVKKLKIQLTDNEYYYDTVAKWFFRLSDVIDSIQNIQIQINRNRFTRKSITTTYNKLVKNINDYNIYLASYHDLLLHLLIAVLRINLPHKNIAWNKIKDYCSNDIKVSVGKIYSLLKEEIEYRNSSLHDFNYSWMEKYFTYETIRLISIMRFPEIKTIMEPLQAPLVYNANIELSEIKKSIEYKIKVLENTTYDFFEKLVKWYEKKSLTIAST